MTGRAMSMEPDLDLRSYDAVVFDMDGLVTDTASVHSKAWKKLVDEVLPELAGSPAASFDIETDYRRIVDDAPARGYVGEGLVLTLQTGRPATIEIIVAVADVYTSWRILIQNGGWRQLVRCCATKFEVYLVPFGTPGWPANWDQKPKASIAARSSPY